MHQFIQPPLTKNYDNNLRNVGFELEFSNISMEDILSILVSKFHFKPKKINNYYYKLASDYGDFVLELDFELLTQQKLHEISEKINEKIGISLNKEDIKQVEEFIGKLSQDIVPYEISTPPLPLDTIDIIETLVDELNQYNAKGTSHKFYYAFGLHINIEVVSLDIQSLLTYFKAYLVLQDFINKDANINLARKITPYIDNFNKDYIQHVLHKDYNPSIEEFIDDYLNFNPTRNRSLDLLPILAYIDEEQVRHKLPKEKIKPRPAFHYRLSNSRIGEKDWQVSEEWNRWILVEQLANDEASLLMLSEEYCNYLDKLLHFTSWDERVKTWIQNH